MIRSLKEHGIGNTAVYAELGGVWREPAKIRSGGPVLGKCCSSSAKTNPLGTDSIWFGHRRTKSNLPRIPDLGRIPAALRHPALTPESSARSSASTPRACTASIRRGAACPAFDPVSLARAEYRNDPAPSFQTYGPKSAAELRALLRESGG